MMGGSYKRRAGILLPISALPSRYGIGCFSESAYRFVDFLCEAGQSEWQILPLGITGYGDSPYQSFSAFAGNPYFISLEGLIEDGLLLASECEQADLGQRAERVDYAKQYENRYRLLHLAYERIGRQKSSAQTVFEKENRSWLEDFAQFMAYKAHFGGLPLSHWSEAARLRDPDALASLREKGEQEIGFWEFLQFRFFEEWERLRAYANRNGIAMIGDLPIYVSADSADLWAYPELFLLDAQRCPSVVAGCPPDAFSPDGQLWGNPLYRWEEHERSGYAWWIERFSHAMRLYDAVRVDHFRGFDEYYAIDANAKDARNGSWCRGCGIALFDAIRQKIGVVNGIAEDLGFLTDSVRRLVGESGFASTKVFMLGFDECEKGYGNEYMPHRYGRRSAAYTGTHDNATLVEWLQGLSAKKEAHLRTYLCDRFTPREQLCEPIIGTLMRSEAERCIIPLQDYLGIAGEGRINRPSTARGNWQWRVSADALNGELKNKIFRLTEIGERLHQ